MTASRLLWGGIIGGNDLSSEPSVDKWLKQNGLESYVEKFAQENITYSSLQDLTDEHLKELGMTLGHRVAFRKAISDMLSGKGTTPTSSPTDSLNVIDVDPLEYSCKVIVVGDQNTGKTSLIERYTHGTFDKGYKATIGVDFCLKDILWNESTKINLQLWDIAGQERYTNLTRMYYKEARGAFVVFDVTKERSLLEGAVKWKADIDKKVFLPNGQPIPVILLANKCDLLQGAKYQNVDLDKFCKEHGFAKWFFTSAKENIQIGEAANFLVETILGVDEDFMRLKASPKKGLTVLPNENQGKSGSSFSCCS